MIPVFKSHFSIGKSILTLDLESSDPEGPDSIFSLLADAGKKKLILVEDNLTSFMKAFNACKELGIELIFGLRLDFYNTGEKEESNRCTHKSIISAKDDEGCRLLNKIYSYSQIHGGGKIDYISLKDFWNEEHLSFAVPFYDSFIHKNNFYLCDCVPSLTGLNPIFWVEENGLPFDHLLRRKVELFVQESPEPYKIKEVKSIFYKNKEDVEAFQTYKILCGRSFWKNASLNNPNLDHFGSDEFCLESFLENE